LLAITLDNTANNGTFVHELEIKLRNEENIEWNSERLRFRCFDHILNLAVQAALNKIKEDIDVIRELNSSICTTPQWLVLLENAYNACGIKFHKPILDCPTRWNSTFEMIMNALFLKP
ncbi:20833_t:CDS:2, partial [Gigaspora rosea]